MRLRGVLVVEPGGTNGIGRTGGLLDPEQRRVIDTCASLMAISIERIHYIDVAQKTTVQMESERLRNSLLSAISHDLRTPLASMVGIADALQMTRPAPTGQQLDLIESMRNSATRMNALVGNLLDMARLESGAVKLNRQWQPLEEVIGSAIGAGESFLAGRAVSVRLPPELPLLQFDAALMERVFVNLLENAAKYTPAGTPIEIRARLDSDEVVINIDDHGPGLPRGREEEIFEKFERGRQEGATPGVGLGLAICRAIMQAHSGTIRGETRGEGGASFILTLPRGKPPADDGSEEFPDEDR
jgi:two-component system sensor histidine kinase KdpD